MSFILKYISEFKFLMLLKYLDFYITTFNDEYSETVDLVFEKCFLKTIQNVQQDYYNVVIEYTDGISLKFWIANKYYGWMSRGDITNQKENITFAWDSGRPSRKNMWVMYQIFEEYKKRKVHCKLALL